MNKTLYKVIFNKQRGVMMAVAENTLREGKSSADTVAGFVHPNGGHSLSGSLKLTAAGLSRLSFSLMLAIGSALIVPVTVSPAHAAGIAADKSAPGNQQPTILQSANGTPQINIQTPGAGGVSMNQYRQFDVDGKGAILNNSRNNTPTQIGGRIQGNPWLAGGEAKIIVNQINSSNPSLLNGYIEVAGRRAEVIIANPAGIQVNGGGFINAAGVTLTGGRPILSHGHLEGFRVRSGDIAVNGAGLDTSGADYTRILAQAAQINAGIWGKDLKIVSGSNDIDATGRHTPAAQAATGPATTDPDQNPPIPATPAVAIDTGSLGGMYAQKITLISTDKGVGINNAGQIFAAAGGVSLSADGQIGNSGQLIAADKAGTGQAGSAAVDISGSGLSNSGSISAQGKAHIRTQSLSNSGLIAGANELNIRNQTHLSNSGDINAARLDIVSGSLNNSGRISQSGLQSLAVTAGNVANRNGGLIGYTPADTPTGGGSGTAGSTPGAGGNTTPPGTAAGGGSTTAAPAPITPVTLADGQLSISGSLLNDKGRITANGGVDLNARNGLANQAQLNLNRLHTGGDLLDNRGGVIRSGSADIRSRVWDNRGGDLSTTDTLLINNQRIDNRGGQIRSANRADLRSDAIDNQSQGSLAAGKTLAVSAAALDNRNGSVVAGQTLSIDSRHIDNRGGGIDAAGTTINTTDLDNRDQGAIRSNQTLHITASGSLNNRGGQLSSAGRLDLTDGGRNTLAVDNNGGGILAGIDGALQSKSLSNNGSLAAGRDLAIALQDSFTVEQDITAGRTLTVGTAGSLSNPHTLQGGESVVIQAAQIDNRAGGKIQSGARTEISAADTLINRGLINSNGLTVVKAGASVDNIGRGKIFGGHVAIGTGVLTNQEETATVKVNGQDSVQSQAAVIAARQRLDVGAREVYNREGALLSSENQLMIGGSLNAQNTIIGSAALLDNASAEIRSGGAMALNADTLRNRNLHFSASVKEIPGTRKNITEFEPDGGSGDKYDSSRVTGWGSHETVYLDGNEHEDYTRYDYTRHETKHYVDQSAPALILAGGGLTLNGKDLVNDKSQILSSGITIVQNNVNNMDADGEHTVIQNGSSRHHHVGWNWKGTSHESQWGETRPYNPADIIRPIKLGVVQYDAHYRGDSGVSKPEALSMQTITVNPGNGNTPAEVRTITPNTRLPGNSLFATNPGNQGWLVETNPAFADYRQWLGSDYMLRNLGLNPDNMHKRLGDGYYEQRLLSEQIARLTGKVRLDGYRNNEEQFKALMDAGITAAAAFKLTPGIALNRAQIARLTSDIVWLVTQDVTLPDGSHAQVLVPQVYVMARPGDLDGSGSLIAADTLQLNLSGKLNNQGTLAGRRIADISAQNIDNIGGLVEGGKVRAQAENDLNNIGGVFRADTALQLKAGGHINSASTTRHTANIIGDSSFTAENIERLAGLYVTGKDGVLLAQAGKDVNLTATDIDSSGAIYMQAGNNLDIGTVNTHRKDHGYAGDDNQILHAEGKEIGSKIQAAGDIVLQSGGKTHIRAAQINSDEGTLALRADKGMQIEAGRASADYRMHTTEGHGNIAYRSETTIRNSQSSNVSVASDLSGKQIQLQSGQDIAIIGSNVVSDQQTLLQAKGSVAISASENRFSATSQTINSKSGLMGSGGFGVFIGSKQDTTDTANTTRTHSGSMVGSLKGDTAIIAGKAYTQTGSTVSAPQGNVDIHAKSVDISAAQNHYANDYRHTFEQKGLTVAVNVPVVSAVQGAIGVAQSAGKIGQSKNDRVNAMAAANTAFGGYQAAQGLAGIAQNPKGAVSQDISVSVTYGQQKNTRQTHIEGHNAEVSKVIGGGKVNISATDGGNDSNINIIGADIGGKQGTHLYADNQINIKSAAQNHSERSKNQSAGWNAGVAISYGQSGMAFGVTAGGNYGKGYGNGDDFTQRHSHIGDAGSRTTLESGGATNIKGAQLIGKGIGTDAAELNIESLQDSAKYNSKQQNVSAQVTIGYGVSGSAGYSQSKIHADYAGVREQSGIFAGDDGYQINIKGHTDLKGGLITGSAKAEADHKNHLTTATLSHSDIHNHAEYSGSSFGLTVSGAINADLGLGKNAAAQSDVKATDDKGNIIKDSNGNAQLASGKSSIKAGKTIGYGTDSGSRSSLTKSGINTANITLTDEAGQQQRTGKTAAQTIAAVKTEISTDNHAEHAGYLKNNFDKDKVQAELDLQRQVTQQFDANRQAAKAEINTQIKAHSEQAEALNAAADKARQSGDMTAYATLSEQAKAESQTAQNWQRGGLALDTIAAGLYSPSSNAGGSLAAAASPAMAQQIGSYFKGLAAQNQDGKLNNSQQAAHVLAHGILAASVAAAGGNDALSTVITAGGAEAAAPYVSQWLYGTDDPEKLSAEQKGTVSAITGLGGAVTGTTTGNVTDVVAGSQAAQNAVENNLLTNLSGEKKLLAKEKLLNKKLKQAGIQSSDDYQNRYNQCTDNACRQQTVAEYKKASELASRIILALYNSGELSADEFGILVTSYASKMHKGAGDSITRGKGNIYELDGMSWSAAATIANPYLNEVYTKVLLSELQKEGASDTAVMNRLEQNRIARDYMLSLPESDQAAMLAAQGFAVSSILNVITKNRGGTPLVQSEIESIRRIANNQKPPSVSTVPGTVYNQQAIKQLETGKLPGVSTRGRTGVPREMAPSSNPNAMAKDFVNKYIGNKKYTMESILRKDGTVYKLEDGTKITYRPGGSASNRTSTTTATVEINNDQLKNLNKGEVLKFKFPIKSEIKK